MTIIRMCFISVEAQSETGPSMLWPVSDRASPGFSTHLKHTPIIIKIAAS